jgi:hypothetical protein
MVQRISVASHQPIELRKCDGGAHSCRPDRDDRISPRKGIPSSNSVSVKASVRRAPTFHIPGGPIALIAPFLEIGFAHRRQDPAPSCLEPCASLFEGGRGTAPIVAGLHARIETAAPFPLLDVDRAARSASDRADMGVTVVDVPAVRALGIAAAGEGGHDPSFRRSGREGSR